MSTAIDTSDASDPWMMSIYVGTCQGPSVAQNQGQECYSLVQFSASMQGQKFILASKNRIS
jgi:hypothetical protein